MQSSRITVMTMLVSFFFVIILTIPLIYLTRAATQGQFSVSLNITNTAPTISWVNDTVSVTPVENGIRTIYIQFNVTDGDGVANINDSTATIVLSLGSEPQRYNTSCTPAENAGNTETFDCAIDMQYYDLNGNWEINASIEDNEETYVENRSFTFSYGPLTAMVLGKSSMNFTGASLGEQDVASDQNPQIINNRGNVNITQVNVTAFDLIKGAEKILATSFTVNATNAGGYGHQMQNDSMVIIENAEVARDINGNDQNGSLYIYVDVPAAGITSGQFDSYQDWLVDVQ